MNKCSLMKIMNQQILGDDYNPPLLWKYERIDEIAFILKMSINTSVHRENLAKYLDDIVFRSRSKNYYRV